MVEEETLSAHESRCAHGSHAGMSGSAQVVNPHGRESREDGSEDGEDPEEAAIFEYAEGAGQRTTQREENERKNGNGEAGKVTAREHGQVVAVERERIESDEDDFGTMLARVGAKSSGGEHSDVAGEDESDPTEAENEAGDWRGDAQSADDDGAKRNSEEGRIGI